MNIVKIIEEIFSEKIGISFTRSELVNLVHEKSGVNKSSIIPSDYCYNRRNKGINFPENCLFERIDKGLYVYLGRNYEYSGLVYFRERGMAEDGTAGEWKSGIYIENYKHIERTIVLSQLEMENRS